MFSLLEVEKMLSWELEIRIFAFSNDMECNHPFA